MTKKRKITKQKYERAKRIVSEYEAQFSLSFVRGSFSLNDLTILTNSITVEKLTEKVFFEDDCYVLEQLLNDKISGLRWCNVDDLGYLSIAFDFANINDELKNTVLECLNAL
jgi:hypothetical protein